ncbi:Kelch repeat-containing protein [Maricaulis sp.]|uniref:Kelch repeat-containing protein n=1 Tax=Maricaulis sp. TaxID=1486257 RepID=UPI003A8E3FB3
MPLILLAGLMSACAGPGETEPEAWAHLPEPVTNNAVAGVELDGRLMAYSFAGLHGGKTWRDVTADAYACDLDARECREIDGLPDGIGRLAAVAVTVRGQIYIFGGYTVAEDGSEASTPEVWRFDPASETYTHLTDMPVPVDDTIALPFEDRYIYLVSGWHDTDNTDLVQVYDVEANRWFEATPFPGAPVFGHAGAMDENGRLLVCGGTAVIPPAREGGRRSFEATDACWAGQVSASPAEIVWQAAGETVSGPFYRGVAIAHPAPLDGYSFFGGSGNAYNYNGIGYDGEAVEPRGDYIRKAFIPRSRGRDGCTVPRGIEDINFLTAGDQRPEGSFMDVRGAVLEGENTVYTLGGMGPGQTVSDHVRRWVLPVETVDLPVCGGE